MASTAQTSPKASDSINLKTLRTVTFDKVFHFFIKSKVYTGVTATSLTEFAEKLETIDAESEGYHFKRQDFQKWVAHVLGDLKLASRITNLNGQVNPEMLRQQIFDIVEFRICEIEGKIVQR
jgi:hypothetical protein